MSRFLWFTVYNAQALTLTAWYAACVISSEWKSEVLMDADMSGGKW